MTNKYKQELIENAITAMHLESHCMTRREVKEAFIAGLNTLNILILDKDAKPEVGDVVEYRVATQYGEVEAVTKHDNYFICGNDFVVENVTKIIRRKGYAAVIQEEE